MFLGKGRKYSLRRTKPNLVLPSPKGAVGSAE